MYGALSGFLVAMTCLVPLNRRVGFKFMPIAAGATVLGASYGLIYTAFLRRQLNWDLVDQ